jgi:hypothetical protein
LVAYNYFVGKAERLVLDIEDHTDRLIQSVILFREVEDGDAA